MNLLILSDIHGNLSAMESVLKSIKDKNIDGCVILGDLIDYGPHSNEVIQIIKEFDIPVICNIWGNHEEAVLDEQYDSFSSQRGVDSAIFTRDVLTKESAEFLRNEINYLGFSEFQIDGKNCLAIHGSLENPFWKSITVDVEADAYSKYDYVFSGHSHYPHFFEKYVFVDNPKHRDKKKIIFINPGSVGQPRNINPNAQYVILNTENENIEFIKVSYDIKREQEDFSDKIDSFYKTRLEEGV